MSYNESARLIDVIGIGDYNNLGEPMPSSNRPELLRALASTFMALSWIFVAFRLYVRWRVVRSPGWDDLFVLLYLICCTVGSVAFIISIDYGTGQHLLLLTFGQVGHYLFTFYIFLCFTIPAAVFIKLSLLCQYLRIFKPGSWAYRASVVTIVLVSAWGIAYGVLAWFPCWPISDFWYSPPDRHCWAFGSSDPDAFTATFVAHGAINLLSDVVNLTIPMSLYFDKNITLKMKMGLLALLVMGAVVNFLGSWRLQLIVKTKAGWYPTHDPTWYSPLSLLLAVLEINIASMCASVPIFWPVLRPYLSPIFVTQEISMHEEYRDVDRFRLDNEDSKSRGSQTELRAIDSRDTNEMVPRGDRDRADHYADTYIMGQVDPLRPSSRGGVKSQVRSESVKGKKRPWQRI